MEFKSLGMGNRIQENRKMRELLQKALDEDVQKINDAAWKPIETAPKDGTEILLVSFGGDIGLCYWRNDAVMTGWTWGLGKAFNGATHWMPLPQAPNASVKAALTQPEQEAVGFIDESDDDGIFGDVQNGIIEGHCKVGDLLYTHPHTEQEPVAWIFDWFDGDEEIKDWTTTSKNELDSMLKKSRAHNIRSLYTYPRSERNTFADNQKLDAFIRAFWRRINAYKNDFEKELPKEMPVQFRASMETALLVFDNDVSCLHLGRHMKRLTDSEKANIAELYNSTSISVAELIESVQAALIEKNK